MLKQLKELVDGKKVFLATHWDADGVSSGAIIYHLIKDWAKSIKTISKGDIFLITKEEVPKDAEIVICTDIHPSVEIEQPVIYIDHHPCDEDEFLVDEKKEKTDFALKVYDKDAQSCTLVIWNKLITDSENPYFVFLTLMGFFGDGGSNMNIPPELEMKAMDMFPELMERKKSYYSDGTYLEIEKYVSALNTGKRMHWSGQVPFEMLKSIESYKPFIYNQHPLSIEIQRYKMDLRSYYSMALNLVDLDKIQYSIIVCDKNIQGVLCAKHMNGKPLLVMNLYKGKIIGSMRVPEELDFDAGEFLQLFSGQIPGLVGGGHEKAGGLTFDKEHLDDFIALLKEKA